MSLYAVNFLWIVSTAVGLALAIYGAREARLDIQALIALRRDGDKRTLAGGAFFAQVLLALGQFAFLIPGLLSLFQPYPENPFSLGAGLLVFGSWCMTGASSIAIYVNKKVR